MTVNIYGQNTPIAPVPDAPVWKRPQYLRSLPAISASDEKIYGLFAVGPDGLGNIVSFTCAGDYTVDWGDGVVENISSGVQANHEYDWNDVDLANTDAQVTITAASGLFTRVGHGFANGDNVNFFRIVTTTGISENVTYWVISATPNTFQVSASKGGAAVVLTGDGSAALSPYKQAIVIITPQGGAQLTSVNFQVKHPSISPSNATYPWLDLAISLPNCSASGLTICLNAGFAIFMQVLQQVTIKNVGALTTMQEMFYSCIAMGAAYISGCNSVTNMTGLFSGCSTLQTVQITNTGSVTTFDRMFQTCNTLRVAPYFDTSAATSALSMFASCYSLQSVPQYDFSKVTSVSFMFSSCWFLQSINLQTSFGVSCDATGMFGSNRGLTSVVLPNTHNIATMQNMFSSCAGLTSVSLGSMQSVTNMTSMFINCKSLTSIALPPTPVATNASSMFSGCNALQSVYLPDTRSVTNMQSMFDGCYALTYGPALNTSSVTNFQSMFNNCYAMQSVPFYNMVAANNAASMFNNCLSLKSVPAFVIGGANANLSDMLRGCNTLTSVGAMNTSTATSFGGMFRGCFGLENVPTLDTSLATTVTSMFRDCSSLQTAPAFNTPLVQDFSFMFYSCYSLRYVPTYNTTSATNFSSMFYSCNQLKYASPFSSTTSVTSFASMLQNLYLLRAPTNYDTSNATTAQAMYWSTPNVSIPAHNLTATNVSNAANVFSTGAATRVLAYGMTRGLSAVNNHLPKAAIETLFGNLGVANAATIAVTNNPGVDTAVSKASLSTTALSTTINMADTSSLTTGMFLTNATIWAPVNFAADVTADTFTLNSHNIPDGTLVSFSSLATVTGVSTFTPYYVVNSAANTFQISLTLGGPPIDLTGADGTVAVKWYSKITTINTNVSIVLDAPAPTSQTGQTISFRLLDATRALLKGWAITY